MGPHATVYTGQHHHVYQPGQSSCITVIVCIKSQENTCGQPDIDFFLNYQHLIFGSPASTFTTHMAIEAKQSHHNNKLTGDMWLFWFDKWSAFCTLPFLLSSIAWLSSSSLCKETNITIHTDMSKFSIFWPLYAMLVSSLSIHEYANLLGL